MDLVEIAAFGCSLNNLSFNVRFSPLKNDIESLSSLLFDIIINIIVVVLIVIVISKIIIIINAIECFHMTSRGPFWFPKTAKRRPYWCPKPVLWELNSFLTKTLSFVLINLRRCRPREWKHYRCHSFILPSSHDFASSDACAVMSKLKKDCTCLCRVKQTPST